ncbi:hypothetical protein [Sphingobium sp.]
MLRRLADRAGVAVAYQICAFLSAIGMVTAFPPNIENMDEQAGRR